MQHCKEIENLACTKNMCWNDTYQCQLPAIQVITTVSPVISVTQSSTPLLVLAIIGGVLLLLLLLLAVFLCLLLLAERRYFSCLATHNERESPQRASPPSANYSTASELVTLSSASFAVQPQQSPPSPRATKRPILAASVIWIWFHYLSRFRTEFLPIIL